MSLRMRAAGRRHLQPTTVASDDQLGSAAVEPLLATLVRETTPVRFLLWDGRTVGPRRADGAVVVRSPMAVRYLLWSPGELGLARAYVAGHLDIDGDVCAVLAALRDGAPARMRFGWRLLPAAVRTAMTLGVAGPPPTPPSEEATLRGWRHTQRRDTAAISHHYDVSNEFYRLVLGPSLTYSCAVFPTPDTDLSSAQAVKHDLICRKLGLDSRAGMRLLDVGCGWGSLAMHAAGTYGAQVVGITVSRAQADLARRRVADAGLAHRIEIRVQDYRQVRGEMFDAIASVGMSEHVGRTRLEEYCGRLYAVLRPLGRLLNHAISSPGGSRLRSRSFVARYVFPDGELLDVAQVQAALQEVGFEIRDVQSLREHYALTLRAWVGNLEHGWDRAVALVGEGRARVWLLYMAGSAVGFSDGGISVHQVLAVKPDADGVSGVPRTRAGWG